ncbi:MAG: cytochrome c maturation protein CcmE [Pseudomonadota bacterium]
MRGLKKQRRVQILIATAVALTLATVLIGYGFRQGINFFRTPSEVAAEPPLPSEVFRIGGLVLEGSLERGSGETVTFLVTDGGASVPVAYTGVLPDLFGEGEGMVGTGSLIGGIFQATEILARHDETYMPAEVIEALQEQGVYREPDA